MPPYQPVKSQAQRRKLFALAQRRKLFALAERGEISMDEARGKARAAKGKRLPERVAKRASSRGGRR